MTGGLLQLVAYGAQDLYLTGNPQVTFFKIVYKRYTNFSMEYIPQYFNTLPSFSPIEGSSVTCKIGRNADLMHDIYFVFDIPAIYSKPEENFKWIENLGENVVRYCNISINGLIIDEMYSQWLNVWNELTLGRDKRLSYDKMIGNTPDMTNPIPEMYTGEYEQNKKPTISGRRLYIPLPFWFCRNPGLSIPLISLQYSDIYINIEIPPLNNLYTLWYGLSPSTFYDVGSSTNATNSGIPLTDYDIINNINNKIVVPKNGENYSLPNVVQKLSDEGYYPLNYFWKFVNGSPVPESNWNQNCYILVNYIYLDDDERKKFAQVSNEYLITQVNREEFSGLQDNVVESLNFFNPVKELIIVSQRNDVNIFNQYNNYSNCIYYDNFYSINWLENLQYFSRVKDFAENNINTCLESFVDIREKDSFNIDEANIIINSKLIFNGHDRTFCQEYNFFNALQSYKYHTNSPKNGILPYSFSIKPEDYQPSGSCNFSRINKVQIAMKLRKLSTFQVSYNVNVYAINLNVFRIISGMGSLVFTN